MHKFTQGQGASRLERPINLFYLETSRRRRLCGFRFLTPPVQAHGRSQIGSLFALRWTRRTDSSLNMTFKPALLQDPPIFNVYLVELFEYKDISWRALVVFPVIVYNRLPISGSRYPDISLLSQVPSPTKAWLGPNCT